MFRTEDRAKAFEKAGEFLKEYLTARSHYMRDMEDANIKDKYDALHYKILDRLAQTFEEEEALKEHWTFYDLFHAFDNVPKEGEENE